MITIKYYNLKHYVPYYDIQCHMWNEINNIYIAIVMQKIYRCPSFQLKIKLVYNYNAINKTYLSLNVTYITLIKTKL
jgi:hypothetical protein